MTPNEKELERELLINDINRCMDAIGLELRVWNASYFGHKKEDVLIERLAIALHTEGWRKSHPANAEIVDAYTLRKWWRFDDNQQPLSTWHDREDFIAKYMLKKKGLL